jgi:four helix bundle protein
MLTADGCGWVVRSNAAPCDTPMLRKSQGAVVCSMRPFRNLLVWKKSRAFLLRIDPIVARIGRHNPRLAGQLRRAAESVPECLAEGCGRATDKDFAHYTSMAGGSASEVENHIQRAFDLRLISEEEYASLTADIVEIRKMLHGLHKRLRGDEQVRVHSATAAARA